MYMLQTCERTFAKDRIQKHIEVCQKTTAKARPVFDVVGNRIGGTEAGEMVAAGKIKLEPAKPIEKKSELMKKYNADSNNTETAGGAQTKDRKPNDENKKGKNGECSSKADPGQATICKSVRKPVIAFSFNFFLF